MAEKYITKVFSTFKLDIFKNDEGIVLFRGSDIGRLLGFERPRSLFIKLNHEDRFIINVKYTQNKEYFLTTNGLYISMLKTAKTFNKELFTWVEELNNNNILIEDDIGPIIDDDFIF